MFCTQCGNKIEDGAKFCVNCGQAVQTGEDATAAPVIAANIPPAPVPEDSVFCINCGEKLAEGAVFCTQCGWKAGGVVPARQEQHEVPAQQEQSGTFAEPAGNADSGVQTPVKTGKRKPVVLAAVIAGVVLLVFAVIQTGRYVTAKTAMERNKRVLELLDQGKSALDQDDYDLAITNYTAAILLDPTNPEAYNGRGDAYNKKEDYDRAIADFTQAITLDSNNAIAYSNRGYSYKKKSDYDQAIADFTQAIKLDPNTIIGYSDRAIVDCTQAIKLDPNDVDAYFIRGNAYGSIGDHDRAIADFTQAIRLAPNSVNAYYNRGLKYFKKGDHDRAIADFTQAIRLDHNDAGAYYNRGNAYFNKGDYNRAITDYEAALRIDPNHTRAGEKLDIVLYTVEIRKNPRNADLYFERGCYYAFGTVYTTLLSETPKAERFEMLLSRTIRFNGTMNTEPQDVDRAVADWETALKLNPNHALAKDCLEFVRQARGH